MQKILEIFEEITQIPHCSYQTKALRDYIVQKATEFGYSTQIDKAGNILCSSPAPKLCLQAHYDMVCVGEAPKIKTIQKDGYLMAKNSSLGADNGIAIAMILHLMSQNASIEALFTNDEEVGLLGAKNLELTIKSPYLLNLDSEDEGEVFIGCAGGVDLIVEKNLASLELDRPYYEVTTQGFRGGHSGVDIDKNIPNAIIELASYLKEQDATITFFKGGEKINSIPVLAKALVQANALKEKEGIVIKAVESNKKGYDSSFLDDIINFPNGVLEQNNEFNVVESSSNIALIECKDGALKIAISMRSLDTNKLNSLAKDALKYWQERGYACKLEGFYPGWKPEYNEFSALVQKSLAQIFPQTKIQVIHAGLECGILKEKLPNVAFASIGPTIKYPHSINERVQIDSIAKTYQALEKIIASL